MKDESSPFLTTQFQLMNLIMTKQIVISWPFTNPNYLFFSRLLKSISRALCVTKPMQTPINTELCFTYSPRSNTFISIKPKSSQPLIISTMAPVVSKIAIIGAGVSGLAAAKQLAHHNPIVFEASDSIGGVWRHCSYSSTKLQSHRCDYEFSDFPWPDRDNASFPSHTEILEYLKCYAEHFDVLKCVRFNSKVVEIRFVGDRETAADFTGEPGNLLPGHPVWEVAVQTNHSDTIQVVIIILNEFLQTNQNSMIFLVSFYVYFFSIVSLVY